jgi:hypothetical protein
LNSEAFFAEPQETLRKIYEFLNIDTGIEIQDLAPKNVGKNRKQVPLAVYEYLDDFFKPYNQALYKAINQDFGW